MTPQLFGHQLCDLTIASPPLRSDRSLALALEQASSISQNPCRTRYCCLNSALKGHFSRGFHSQSLRKFCAMVPPQESFSQRQKLRVLCLHGFRTNGVIMETQLRKLDRTALDLLDMTCLDAPYPAAGKSDVEGIFPPPYYEWFQFEQTETGPVFSHLKECIQFIEDFMEKNGPFDGLVGFSQGAFLSAALAGMQQQGLALTSVPKLRFVINISGGVLDGEHEWKDCYSRPIKCPSVHFIGSRDFLKARNEKLLLKFENPLVIRHEAKHTVPRLDEKAVLPMRSFLEDILSTIKEEEDEHVVRTIKGQEENVSGHSSSNWTCESIAALA